MKPYSNITCAVLTGRDLTAKEEGKNFLTALMPFAWALPTVIGNSEPLREKYVGEQEALGHWQDPFLWKNTSTAVEGSVWFGHGNLHSCIYLHLKPLGSMIRQEELTRFVSKVSQGFDADFGYIHLTTEREMADPAILRGLSYAVDTGLTTHDLIKGIPKLCWAMVFGSRYEDIASRFASLKPQESLTTRLEDGKHTLVQLNNNLVDSSDDYETFKNVRNKIVQVVGDDFLRKPDGGPADWRPNFSFRV